MESMLYKPLSCSLFALFAFLFTFTNGALAAPYRASSAPLALNLLTSIVCHWCVLAMWRHSTLANSRTTWDQVGPECSCKMLQKCCKMLHFHQFSLHSKSSKGSNVLRANRRKAASQFFMSLKVFADVKTWTLSAWSADMIHCIQVFPELFLVLFSSAPLNLDGAYHSQNKAVRRALVYLPAFIWLRWTFKQLFFPFRTTTSQGTAIDKGFDTKNQSSPPAIQVSIFHI